MDSPRIDRRESNRAQRIARVLLALVLIALGLWTLREFLPALAWAGILAIAFWPSYQRATLRWPPGHHNILLPLAFTLAIALVFVLPIVLAGMQVSREARTVWAWIETARREGIPVPDTIAHLPFIGEQARAW